MTTLDIMRQPNPVIVLLCIQNKETQKKTQMERSNILCQLNSHIFVLKFTCRNKAFTAQQLKDSNQLF